ncbi:MAG: helix-turn-helix transcriptional regulator [Anaerolineae bacterium]|nr:helix-turn-helix transcriptional regulator [Anaerolineae bacterium]
MKYMDLLRQAVASQGQAAVARAIGYSDSAVSQALSGKYRGSLENLLCRVNEVYGSDTVQCPVMGPITIQRCAAERRKPFAASSPQRVKLFNACRHCEAGRQ